MYVLVIATSGFIFVWLLVGLVHSFLDQAATPLIKLHNSSPISTSSENVTWFIQISDLHISEFQDPGRVDDLLTFTSQLDIFHPAAVVVTGDLTHAVGKFSNDDWDSESGQSDKEWEMYRMVKAEGRKKCVWFDVPGNHDKFDVNSTSDQNQMFLTDVKAGGRGGSVEIHQGRHILHLVENRGVKLAFIGIDATTNPGLRPPLNFIGQLKQSDLEDINILADRAEEWTENIIWFGHYPTSTITSHQPGLREVCSGGLIYLCGHLHSVYGAARDMVAVHSTGLLEAELEDWKDARMVRLVAVDQGRVSFTDFEHGIGTVVHVSWPPRIGRETLIRNSTAIRLLLFPRGPILGVSVRIDGEEAGACTRDSTLENLYTLEWNQDQYTMVHTMEVKVDYLDGSSSSHTHVFSVTGLGFSNLPLFSRFMLLADLPTVFKALFLLSLVACVLPLLYCRSSLGTGSFLENNPLFSNLFVLAAVDSLYRPLLLYPIYLAWGPWCCGQLMTGRYGFVFTWGTVLLDPLELLSTESSWFHAFKHLSFVHLPAILLLANLAAARRNKLRHKPANLYYHVLIHQLPLLVLVGSQCRAVKDFYYSYGVFTLVGPLRMGSLVLNLLLWARVHTLDISSFGPIRNRQSQDIHCEKSH